MLKVSVVRNRTIRKFLASFISSSLAVSMMSFTVLADGEKTGKPVYDRDYTYQNILTDYMYFAEKDLTATSHQVGAFACGGDLIWGNGGQGQTVASYANNIVEFGASQNDLGQWIKDSDLKDKNVFAGSYDGNLSFIQENGNFIDMDKAFKALESQSNDLNSSADYVATEDNLIIHNIAWMPDPEIALNINIDDFDGKNIRIPASLLDGVLHINITNNENNISMTDLARGGYVITFDDVKDIDLVFTESCDSTKHANPVYLSVNADLSNLTPFNSINERFNNTGLATRFKKDLDRATDIAENDEQINLAGMNLLFNFPDADDVRLTLFEGHILAPNATVHVEGGHFEGGIIAENIDNSLGNEGHYYPFNTPETHDYPLVDPDDTTDPDDGNGGTITDPDDGNGGTTTDPDDGNGGTTTDPDDGNGGTTTDPDDGNGGTTTDPDDGNGGTTTDPDDGNGGTTTDPDDGNGGTTTDPDDGNGGTTTDPDDGNGGTTTDPDDGNGGTTTDPDDGNGGTTTDPDDGNGGTTTDPDDGNGGTTTDPDDGNGGTTTDPDDGNGGTTTDPDDGNGGTTTDPDDGNGGSTTDPDDGNGGSTTDPDDGNGGTTTDPDDGNGGSTTDPDDGNGGTTTDPDDGNGGTTTDPDDGNGGTTTDPDDGNGGTTTDPDDGNGGTTTDPDDGNGGTTTDPDDGNGGTTTDPDDGNGGTTTDPDDGNGGTTTDPDDGNGGTTTDPDDGNGGTTTDPDDGNGGTTTDPDDGNGGSTTDPDDGNGGTTTDPDDGNGGTTTDPDDGNGGTTTDPDDGNGGTTTDPDDGNGGSTTDPDDGNNNTPTNPDNGDNGSTTDPQTPTPTTPAGNVTPTTTPSTNVTPTTTPGVTSTPVATVTPPSTPTVTTTPVVTVTPPVVGTITPAPEAPVPDTVDLELLVVTDGNNTPIVGAEIEIIDSLTGISLGTVTTDETGKFVIPNIPVGSYTVIQRTTTDGYEVNEKEFSVVVDENHKVFVMGVEINSLTIVNTTPTKTTDTPKDPDKTTSGAAGTPATNSASSNAVTRTGEKTNMLSVYGIIILLMSASFVGLSSRYNKLDELYDEPEN